MVVEERGCKTNSVPSILGINNPKIPLAKSSLNRQLLELLTSRLGFFKAFDRVVDTDFVFRATLRALKLRHSKPGSPPCFDRLLCWYWVCSRLHGNALLKIGN